MKKILLAEDELFVQELYQRQLQKAGHEVIVAQNGEECLNLAAQHPDLILLDIMLPRVDGIKALKKLKANNETKNIPVILLTNLGQTEIIRKAYSLGAQGYFLKVNIDPTALTEIVQKFLGDSNYVMDYNRLDLD